MITIIIPVYNEEKIIREILGTLPYGDNIEVIIVDGGSNDRTVEFAGRYPVKVIESIKNRAVQMNKGAESACGDILLFLHADCLLEQGSLDTIQSSLNDGYIGGCLSQKIKSRKIIFRCIEASGNIRAKLFKIFYGDQAIFVRRDIFLQLGGFDNVSLFDDIIFSKKLKKIAFGDDSKSLPLKGVGKTTLLGKMRFSVVRKVFYTLLYHKKIGKTRVLNKKIYTSDRRWERQGIIKATLINWLITVGFILGISSEKLKKIYYDIR